MEGRAVFRLAGLALLVAALAVAARGDDPLDGLDEALSMSGFQDQVRARISGTAELEGYESGEPNPGFIVSNQGAALFVPRLTAYLDAQLGRYFYAFVQSRADNGFDPGYEGGARVRADEYVLRFTPSRTGLFNLQVGKFATVVGNWTLRHDAWDNPFITAPLPYDNLTGVWDAVAVRSTAQLLEWAHVVPYPPAVADPNKLLRLPIIWGPSYTAGAAVSGQDGALDYAFEVKNAALSSRPVTWSPAQTRWHDPTWSGRIGLRPDEAWMLGVSASEGPYLRPFAAATIPFGRDFRSYREMVFGQDLSYAWHHFQAWAEAYEARFEIPAVGNADTAAYYVEAKYRFAPRFSAAVRWGQQLYGTVPAFGRQVAWGRDLWRVEVAPAYRLTAHIQVKVQASLEQGTPDAHGARGMLAEQLTIRW
jgi:hypothetical protein